MGSSSPALEGRGDLGAGAADGVADPAARPVRRSFTAEYRARVVAEYEAAPRGEKSAVLRREGLYQSQLREWAIARDAVARGTTARRRPHRATGSPGGKPEPDRLRGENRLRAENLRLTRELATSQAVVEIMGKLHVLLETISEGTDTPPPSAPR